jgi:2-keto-3-deoxy-L-rhamnonate aldolase RhmA
VLDAGADGIIVPQVSVPEEAERAVRLAHYPPRGVRGLGTGRANRYGLGLAGHVGRAGERVTVVVQAETAAAIENIEAIARVPDLDAVFVGPFDLSTSLGHPGELDHPVVRGAVARIAEVCGRAGVRTGIFAVGAAGLVGRPGQGFTLLAAGVDTALLGTAAEALALELRRSVAVPGIEPRRG